MGAQLWNTDTPDVKQTVICTHTLTAGELVLTVGSSKSITTDYASTDTVAGTDWKAAGSSTDVSEIDESLAVITCSATLAYKKPISGLVAAPGSTWTDLVGTWEA